MLRPLRGGRLPPRLKRQVSYSLLQRGPQIRNGLDSDDRLPRCYEGIELTLAGGSETGT